MRVLARAVLDETRSAFDGVAADYDRSNVANPMLSAMRERAIRAVRASVPRGSRVLDLGCGPGTDSDALVSAGYWITAIDWSPAMVDETRQRIVERRLGDRVEVQHLGIHELDRLPAACCDAAISNFGPLNCVPDLPHTARLIFDRLRPKGVLVASVIGRVVPWEIALYAARGNWARARIRFANGFVPVPLNGRRVWTRYYTPGEFERAFRQAGFTRVSLRALGLFVPPPYMDAFAGRHPALIGLLQRLEDAVASWPGVRSAGDHFLIVLRKP